MKQQSPQKSTHLPSAAAHNTSLKGISQPAVSPIQRKPAFHVDPDNSEKLPEGIEDQWKTTVEQALTSLAESSPNMEELITALQSDRLDVNFILGNTDRPSKSAIGETKNPEVSAAREDLMTNESGQLKVGHLTAAPKKELNIYLYKQAKHLSGTTIQNRYELSHAQIHGTILHELLMHGHPHLEHMQQREDLQDRPDTIAFNGEELRKYKIPELSTSLQNIVEAKDHKLMHLWEEKTEASMAYKDNSLINKQEMLLHHVNDMLEHVAMDRFDDGIRDQLVDHLISIAAKAKDKHVDDAIKSTARHMNDEVERSGTPLGIIMSGPRKESIKKLFAKFPSEHEIPKEDTNFQEEEESEIPEITPYPEKKKLKTENLAPTTITRPFPSMILPPPQHTTTSFTPPSRDTSRPSLFDSLPKPRNTTTGPSLFSMLPPPKNSGNSAEKPKSDNNKDDEDKQEST